MPAAAVFVTESYRCQSSNNRLAFFSSAGVAAIERNGNDRVPELGKGHEVRG